MIVTCHKCEEQFDDLYRTWVCPHPTFEPSADAKAALAKRKPVGSALQFIAEHFTTPVGFDPAAPGTSDDTRQSVTLGGAVVGMVPTMADTGSYNVAHETQRVIEALDLKGEYNGTIYSALTEAWLAGRKAGDRNEVRRLLFQVLHQRTGPMGLKVEDDLLRENEPLLLECIKHTRDL